MLDAFASVGAETFDLTLRPLDPKKKLRFFEAVPLERLRRAMGGMITKAAERQFSVIVRPRASSAVFLQLDDLDGEAVAVLRPLALLAVRTSPGSYQAWLALSEPADVEFVRALKRGMGADPGASGAVRITGSLNFKERYAPNYSVVELVYANPGRMTSEDRLSALGVAAGEDAPAIGPARPVFPEGWRRRWPSYQKALAGAPRREGGTGPDRSKADFHWCQVALDWGWTVEETAAQLLVESEKARERKDGEAYAWRTAERAATVFVRDRGRRR